MGLGEPVRDIPDTPSNRAAAARLVDADLVRRLIASQFPQWADLPVRQVARSGHDNRTFHLGDGMSVRLPSAQAYAAQVAEEQRWLPFLAPFLPMQIPEPLAMGTPDHVYPWNWSVYRWLPGEATTQENVRSLPDFSRQIAAFLASLQKIDTASGPSRAPIISTGAAVWRSTMTKQDLRSPRWADASTKARPIAFGARRSAPAGSGRQFGCMGTSPWGTSC